MSTDVPFQEAAPAPSADEANAQRTFIGDVQWLMTSPRGRRFIWWLLGQAGIYRLSFNNSGSVTAFNEGQRNIGLLVQAKVAEHAPAHYLTMLDEQGKTKQ